MELIGRVETKHLSRREVKIMMLRAIADEWLATAEAINCRGYETPNGYIDYDEKTSDFIAEEAEKIADSLHARANKLSRQKPKKTQL